MHHIFSYITHLMPILPKYSYYGTHTIYSIGNDALFKGVGQYTSLSNYVIVLIIMSVNLRRKVL